MKSNRIFLLVDFISLEIKPNVFWSTFVRRLFVRLSIVNSHMTGNWVSSDHPCSDLSVRGESKRSDFNQTAAICHTCKPETRSGYHVCNMCLWWFVLVMPALVSYNRTPLCLTLLLRVHGTCRIVVRLCIFQRNIYILIKTK